MTKTKVCNRCKRELPIDRFRAIKGKNGAASYYWLCKECDYKYKKAYHIARKRVKLNPNINISVKREFKEIEPTRILDVSELRDITLCGRDEIFVKLMDYKNAWLSNYGRCLRYTEGKYKLRKLHGRAYMLSRNVNENGVFKYKSVFVPIAQAVVDTFIVNPDTVNNISVWHKGDNKNDYYYRNLYPLNRKQRSVLNRYFRENNDDSEAVIGNIINDFRYKPDTFRSKTMEPVVRGIGYHGRVGVSRRSPAYSRWHNMLERCYTKKRREEDLSYKDCTVCMEWHNFSNFEKWYNENYYELEGQKMELDKDILCKGNRVYSPTACCIVPQRINSFFVKRKKLNELSKEDFLRYKKEKEKRIKEIAEEFKGKIPDKLYKAMLNWSIEIDD